VAAEAVGGWGGMGICRLRGGSWGMSTPNTTKTFKVTAAPPSRLFRQTQIDRNRNGDFGVGIGSMDFFGPLFLAS
jgi:hypothetical protein